MKRNPMTFTRAAVLALILAAFLGGLSQAFAKDDAEELYRRAARALDRNAYSRAAELYADVYGQYAKSAFAADALYYRAFALYRLGGSQQLQEALSALEMQASEYPRAGTLSDAESLRLRIRGALAELGDAGSAAEVLRRAETQAVHEAQRNVRAEMREIQAESREVSREAREHAHQSRHRDDEDELSAEEELRLTALMALMNMDPESAQPILEKVLRNRETTSAALRAQAVFILAQSEVEGNEALLMDVIRNDTDPEVRQHAMFWLGQVPGDMALDLIEEILAGDDDPELKERALFSLGQNEHERAGAILKRTAMDANAPSELRSMAVFWIGQRVEEESMDFLKDIFTSVDDPELKERVLFSIAQVEDEEAAEWLLEVALDEKQPLELRGRAVFWAGQMGDLPLGKLEQLYKDIDSVEVREQILFTLAQQDDPAAAETLMNMAREETNVQLKARAVFWIGQTDHPDAAAFLEEIITN